MGAGAGAAAVGPAALAVGHVRLVVGRVEVLAVPAGREDDGLADHLALGVRGDLDRVGAGAGRAADKVVVVGRRPAPVADVALGHLALVGLARVACEHAEALNTKGGY